jgi:hypothetical protein
MMRDHYDDPLTWEEKRQFLEDAIVKQERMTYGVRNQFSITPFESNDLGDKVYQYSGELLTAFINNDNETILRIMRNLCTAEMDSLHDLIYG